MCFLLVKMLVMNYCHAIFSIYEQYNSRFVPHVVLDTPEKIEKWFDDYEW